MIDKKLIEILNANEIAPPCSIVIKKYADFKLVLRDIEVSRIDMQDDFKTICFKLLTNQSGSVSNRLSLSRGQTKFSKEVSKDSDKLFEGANLTQGEVSRQIDVLKESGSFIDDSYKCCSVSPDLNSVFTQLQKGIDACGCYEDMISIRVLQVAYENEPVLTALASSDKIAKIVTLVVFFNVVHGHLYNDNAALYKRILDESLKILYYKVYGSLDRSMHFIRTNALPIQAVIIVGTICAFSYCNGGFNSEDMFCLKSSKKILVDTGVGLLKNSAEKLVGDGIQAIKGTAAEAVESVVKELTNQKD